jgi:hypothetical protein
MLESGELGTLPQQQSAASRFLLEWHASTKVGSKKQISLAKLTRLVELLAIAHSECSSRKDALMGGAYFYEPTAVLLAFLWLRSDSSDCLLVYLGEIERRSVDSILVGTRTQLVCNVEQMPVIKLRSVKGWSKATLKEECTRLGCFRLTLVSICCSHSS